MWEVLTSKPVLIGLHLGFAILAIDSYLWILGEIAANSMHQLRRQIASIIGIVSLFLSWIIGGYYYVNFYGPVKAGIKEGLAPWAHLIAMETKEHIFLFMIPLAFTAIFLAFLDNETFQRYGLRKWLGWLALILALIGLSIGAMGFIISAAARWGAI